MFSIIMPLDSNRFKHFKETKRVYDAMPQKKEFLLPTRSEVELRKYVSKHKLARDIRIIPYTVEQGFNCSRALNIGVRKAKYSTLIVTSPEVKPITPVLAQLELVLGTNVICQVFDEDKYKKRMMRPLISSQLDKSKNPQMYFLAMFNKRDIEAINGWDEEFMGGYAFEDCDFGARWERAKLPFVVRDDIQGLHQYHPRGETIPGGWARNERLFYENTRVGIIRVANGLVKE